MVDGCINFDFFFYTTAYTASVEMSELLLQIIIWVHPTNVMLSEKGHSQKGKHGLCGQVGKKNPGC